MADIVAAELPAVSFPSSFGYTGVKLDSIVRENTSLKVCLVTYQFLVSKDTQSLLATYR